MNTYGSSDSGVMAPPPKVHTGNDSDAPGMSSFLPGFQNTTEREAPLQQKRKLQDNLDDNGIETKKNKGNSFLGSTGGMLGAHLKAERKKLAENGDNAGQQQYAGAIDLTDDTADSNTVEDDDDLVITGATTAGLNDEVCLGLLRIKINCYRVPESAQTLGPEFWPPTKVTLKRTARQADQIIDVIDKKGNKFARIPVQAAAALVPLYDASHINGVRMKVMLDRRPRIASEPVGMPTSQTASTLIHLYCPRRKADQIGKWLSQKQLFLEAPLAVEPGREILNPHVPQAYRDTQIGSRTRPATGHVSYVQRSAEEMKQDANALFENLVSNDSLPEMEANDDYISTPLMPHQKQALSFLTEHENHDENLESGNKQATDNNDKEKFSLWKRVTTVNGREKWYNVITGQESQDRPSPVYGGILADMMGLGKTLSILSLIAASVDDAESFMRQKPQSGLEGVRMNARTTLIVCPKSVLSNWSEQLHSHIKPGMLSMMTYHGASRSQVIEDLAQYDIILTTYGTVSSELKDALKKKTALSSVQWFRIVLDEAHTIRNSNTSASKGICKLNAQRRWAVTGTPVQNKLDDLGALIRFLRIKPFDEPGAFAQYIIAPFKNANEDVLQHLRLLVDSITLRRLKDTIGMTKRTEMNVRLDFSADEKRLYARFASQSNAQLRSMTRNTHTLRGKSYAHVLKSILRLRMICDHGREMLSPEDLKDLEGMDESNAIELGDEPEYEVDRKFVSDRTAYELLNMQAQNDMDQCCGCDTNIVKKNKVDDDEERDDVESSDDDDLDESIGSLTPCYHLYCAKCTQRLMRETRPPELRVDGYHHCQVCGSYQRFEFFELTQSGYQSYLDEFVYGGSRKQKVASWTPENYSGPTTKVKALLGELANSAKQTSELPDGEPPIRSVVFSEWTSYLDLLEYALIENNIQYARLDGTMSVKKRAAVQHAFKTDPNVTVMLVSIRAGGQGLNFTCANKVYMMEPQFNPGVEQQAIDRVHRLGQERDVEITHYIMRESVEEGLLKLQDKKKKLAQLSMEKNKASRSQEAKQRIEELRDLFK